MHTKPIQVDTVPRCNKLFCRKVLHPLVSLIPLTHSEDARTLRTECYCILTLKLPSSYTGLGRTSCDFTAGTVVLYRPGEVVDLSMLHEYPTSGQLLVFHPTLIQGTALGSHISSYPFFGYRPQEALHLSSKEQHVLQGCLTDLKKELLWGIDDFSKPLICNIIDLLLNYTQRFYVRQFVTRHDAEAPLIVHGRSMLLRSLHSPLPRRRTMPTISEIAFSLGHSEAYYDSILRAQTGKSFAEYAKLLRWQLAQHEIAETDKPFEQIADEMDFPSVNCMSSLMRRLTGKSLQEIRDKKICPTS